MSDSDFTDRVVVATVEKNASETIVASTLVAHGRECIDVRIHYLDAEGQPRPTRRGIMLSVSTAEAFGELVAKLVEAAKQDAPDETE